MVIVSPSLGLSHRVRVPVLRAVTTIRWLLIVSPCHCTPGLNPHVPDEPPHPSCRSCHQIRLRKHLLMLLILPTLWRWPSGQRDRICPKIRPDTSKFILMPQNLPPPPAPCPPQPLTPQAPAQGNKPPKIRSDPLGGTSPSWTWEILCSWMGLGPQGGLSPPALIVPVRSQNLSGLTPW